MLLELRAGEATILGECGEDLLGYRLADTGRSRNFLIRGIRSISSRKSPRQREHRALGGAERRQQVHIPVTHSTTGGASHRIAELAAAAASVK